VTERHRSIVDVHLVVRRHGRVLMLRRVNTSFGEGLLCFPSGHLERGESVVEGVIREAREEIGVAVDPDALRFVHVMHRGDADGHDRIGLFFEAEWWVGEPVNAEPHKCSELVWVDPADPPDDVVPYQAAGLAGSLGPAWFSLLDWTADALGTAATGGPSAPP
jgi:8-oxo-dGTP diphosphatase